MGKLDRAVEELSAMLDTFYTDVDAWLELADIYASCQQYVLSPCSRRMPGGFDLLSRLPAKVHVCAPVAFSCAPALSSKPFVLPSVC